MMGWMWQFAPVWGMWIVLPFGAAVLVLTGGAIGFALARRRGLDVPDERQDPYNALQLRYVRGEIGEQEFLKKRDQLPRNQS